MGAFLGRSLRRNYLPFQRQMASLKELLWAGACFGNIPLEGGGANPSWPDPSRDGDDDDDDEEWEGCCGGANEMNHWTWAGPEAGVACWAAAPWY